MTSWVLLGKVAMLGGGFLAASATLGTLTAPPMQRDEPALVRHWGKLVMASPAPATPSVARDTSEPAFRLGPSLPVPACADEQERAAPAAPEAVPSPAAPADRDRRSPGPEEIGRAMHALLPAVQRCYDTGMVPGHIELTLVVSGESGRVLESTVSESSSTGRCLQRLGERVRFAPFARTRFTLRWPFSFR